MVGTVGKILGTTVRNSDWVVAGLIQGNDGQAITQATVASISYVVTRFGSTNADGTLVQDGKPTVTGSGALTVAAVVFNSPVTNDPRYTLSGGYDFLAVIPASSFPVAGLAYEVAVTFVTATGGGSQFTQVWRSVPQ